MAEADEGRAVWHDRVQRRDDHYVELPGHTQWLENHGTCLWWMRTLYVCTCVVALLLIPYGAWLLYQKNSEYHESAFFAAGAFVLLTVPMSIWDIFQHLIYYSQPKSQRHIIRILWLVPIYSVESWLALHNDNHVWYGEAFQVAREAYEGFVIYSFMNYLIAALGGQHRTIQKLADRGPEHMHHMGGVQYLFTQWNDPVEFLHRIKLGVFQYVFCQVCCTLATLIMISCFDKSVYGTEEGLTFKNGYSYVFLILNVSQCWAIYCLVLFYHSFMGDEDFEATQPFGKFISVKGLVFFTFWQSMGFSLLVKYGVIHGSPQGFWNAKDIEAGLEDFTICVEMFFFALAHKWCFSYMPFKAYLEQELAEDLMSPSRNSRYGDLESVSPQRRLSGTRTLPYADRSLVDNFKDLFNGSEVTADAANLRDAAGHGLRKPLHRVGELAHDFEGDCGCGVCTSNQGEGPAAGSPAPMVPPRS